MDIAAFALFFLIVVPFWLIHITRQRKQTEQMLASQKEINRLLAELLSALKKSMPAG